MLHEQDTIMSKADTVEDILQITSVTRFESLNESRVSTWASTLTNTLDFEARMLLITLKADDLEALSDDVSMMNIFSNKQENLSSHVELSMLRKLSASSSEEFKSATTEDDMKKWFVLILVICTHWKTINVLFDLRTWTLRFRDWARLHVWVVSDVFCEC